MLYTLTDDPSQCMWHNLRDTVDPASLARERAGEILVCTTCAPCCAAAMRATLSDENHRRLVGTLPPDAPFARCQAILNRALVSSR